MRYLIEMGFKNAFKSKTRLIFIPLLMACGLLVIGTSHTIYTTVIQDLETLEDDVSSEIYITVYNDNKPIPMVSVKKIEQIDGIESMSINHYLSCYLGDMEQDLITPYRIIEFDFDKHKLRGAEDYRGKNVSGILLPESYNLSQLSGKTKLYLDYLEDDEIKTFISEYEIFGYYRNGSSDSEVMNDIYMSSGLYKELLASVNVSENPLELKIYCSDESKKDEIMSQVKNMGYTAYVKNDDSMDNYLSLIRGMRNTSLVIGLVLIVLSVITVLQTLNGSVRRREKAIGIMKAFGYKNSRILLMICTEFAVYAIISLIITTTANILLSEPISKLLAFAVISRDYIYSLSQLLIEVFAVLILMILSVIGPWYKCTRVNTIEVLKSSNG